MGNAGLGGRGGRGGTKVRMTMIGRRGHELAAHHRRLHTVLLVSGPRIPLLHSALVCCWFSVPAFLSCILHRVESPNSSLFSHTADRCSWTATLQSPNPVSAAGVYRPPLSPFTSRSARPTPSASSIFH